MRFLITSIIICLFSILNTNANSYNVRVGEPFSCPYPKCTIPNGFINSAQFSCSDSRVTITNSTYGTAEVNTYFSGSVTIECFYQIMYYVGSNMIPQSITRTDYHTVTCRSNDISISASRSTLKVGEQVQMKYSFSQTPYAGIQTQIKWVSKSPSVASVSSTGIVTAIGSGTARIEATSNLGGNIANFTITVEDEPILPSSILIPDNITLYIGESKQLHPTITPSNAQTAIYWNVVNSSIATVSQNGLVTGMSEGNTTITAETSNGKRSSCLVSVKQNDSSNDNDPNNNQDSSENNKTDEDEQPQDNDIPKTTGRTFESYISLCGYDKVKVICEVVSSKGSNRKCIIGTTDGRQADVDDIINNGEFLDLKLEIPDSIGSYQVIGIGRRAFANNPTIYEVWLPASIETIGNEAFYNCPNIHRVDIPRSEPPVLGTDNFTMGQSFFPCNQDSNHPPMYLTISNNQSVEKYNSEDWQIFTFSFELDKDKFEVQRNLIDKIPRYYEVGEDGECGISENPEAPLDENYAILLFSVEPQSDVFDISGIASLLKKAKKPGVCLTLLRMSSPSEIKNGYMPIHVIKDSWVGKYKLYCDKTYYSATRHYPTTIEFEIVRQDNRYIINNFCGFDLTHNGNESGFIFEPGTNENTGRIVASHLSNYGYFNSKAYSLANTSSCRYFIATKDYLPFYSEMEPANAIRLERSDDGEIKMSDFGIIRYLWDEKNGYTDPNNEVFFSNISSVKNSNIEEIMSEDNDLYIDNNGIKFDTPKHITIYSSNGQLIYSGQTDNIFNLSSGLYFIKYGEKNHKILIR